MDIERQASSDERNDTEHAIKSFLSSDNTKRSSSSDIFTRRSSCKNATRRSYLAKSNSIKNSLTYKKSPWGVAINTDTKVRELGAASKLSKKIYSIEEAEKEVREKALSNPLKIMIFDFVAAVKVFAVYLVTLESLLSMGLSVGLALGIYFKCIGNVGKHWTGGSMDWVLLGFAVVVPLSRSVGMGFNRREQALTSIIRFKSFAYQLYIAHSTWEPSGGRSRDDADCLRHSDEVIEHLIGIGDELTRFLTLPTYTRTRHWLLKSGRIEAARTIEVAYSLFDSLYTQRVLKLSLLTEVLKADGLTSSEVARIRQYERYLGEHIDHLRIIKIYRTPQVLRAFGRIFTVILSPFYAPSYAQLAIDQNSLAMGVLMAIFVPLCLTALFESIEVIEDPFTGFITLDSIDVVEELQVLLWQQLVEVRKIIYPNAPIYPPGPTQPVMWEKLNDEVRNSTDRCFFYQVSLADLQKSYEIEDHSMNMRKRNSIGTSCHSYNSFNSSNNK